MPYSLANSVVLVLGLTLNPIIIALEAWASLTSLSVIVPTPLLITLTLTPSRLIFSNDFLTASSLPLTSVLRITLTSLTWSFSCWS